MSTLEIKEIKRTKKAPLQSAEKKEKKTDKKMSMWDYAMKFKEKPVIKVLDEDLVFGPNMWPRLLKEE